MKKMQQLQKKILLLAAVFAIGIAVSGCQATGGMGGKSVEELTSAANSGDPNASLKLADHYFKQKNYTESEKWYKKAAEQFKTK